MRPHIKEAMYLLFNKWYRVGRLKDGEAPGEDEDDEDERTFEEEAQQKLEKRAYKQDVHLLVIQNSPRITHCSAMMTMMMWYRKEHIQECIAARP